MQGFMSSAQRLGIEEVYGEVLGQYENIYVADSCQQKRALP